SFQLFLSNLTSPTQIYTLSLTTLFRSVSGNGKIRNRIANHDQFFVERIEYDIDKHCQKQRNQRLDDAFKLHTIIVVYRGLSSMLDRKSTRLNSSHDQISYAVF